MEHMKFLPSFGRKRARGLSKTQQENLVDLYNKHGIDLDKITEESISSRDPKAWFDLCYTEFYLEIGFGRGEHLIQNAKNNPTIGFIGCEPFENGVAAVLKEIEENNLNNVKIFKGDARLLLEKILCDSISRVYVLFPDPWHKKRHHKRRILSSKFIKDLQEKHISELVVATDCQEYMESVLEILNQLKINCPDNLDDLSLKPDWFLYTRYEQKALSKGSKCYYLKVSL